MKILQLKFKNINSLAGEHKIDFANDKLANSGIFAIVGKTGSGKSTTLMQFLLLYMVELLE